MVLDHMVQEQLVLDRESRSKSQKSDWISHVHCVNPSSHLVPIMEYNPQHTGVNHRCLVINFLGLLLIFSKSQIVITIFRFSIKDRFKWIHD